MPNRVSSPACLGGYHKGAASAVAHRIAKLIWLILHQGVEYQEKGSAPLHPKILQRKLGRLLKEFANA